ncbi:MAG: carboxypeptidase regulatory-like domain-containing protein [Acidobacteria bacterium]|nr:carboxypeptidase regulatory-like domain-containing protein [Acidobacteriota bacterium]MCW5969867.1 carboxypeptidase regulatory-like domain-containing protein [Blastocatellales bacterium]
MNGKGEEAMKSREGFARMILFLLTLTSSFAAQTATATLKGSVGDSAGNAVAGAEVALVETATGLKRSFITDAGGQYVFALIGPGEYIIEARAAGFAAFRQTRRIQVGQTAELNIALSPEGVEETVYIAATDAAGLDTATSSLGGLVGRQRVASLPLNGRNVFQLAQLEIGVTTAPGSRGANPDLTASGEISVNGGRTLNTEALLDGMVLSNKGDNRLALRPSPDAVQEFQILTNSFPAEYGRTGGGALNFSTRAGTSEFHGALFEYLRNDAFDARSFFVNANPNGVREKLRFNQFGGNLGGPVLFPGFSAGRPELRRGKDLFFFFNYEALRISQTHQRPATVPTVRMRGGDFSELIGAEIPGLSVLDTNGNLIPARIGQVYVPGPLTPEARPGAGSRVAFAGNVIPAAMINPVGRAALGFYPLPNAAGVANATGLGFNNNYIANVLSRTDNYQIAARIDYHPTSTQQLFWRVVKDSNVLFNSGPFPASIASPQPNPLQTAAPGTYLVSYINTLSPKLVLHLNAGMTRFNNDATHFSHGFDPTSLGLPAYVAAASDDARIFPTFNPGGYGSLGPPRNFGYFRNNQDAFSLNETLSWLRGDHALRFGANQRVYRMYNNRPDDPAGNFTFTRSFTARTPVEATPQTGDAIASLLLGHPASGRLGIAPQPAIQSLYYAFFVHDDWKVHERLTLNLGLRWEADMPNTERFDRLTNFDPAAGFPAGSLNVVFPEATGIGARIIALRGAVAPVGRGGVRNRENFDRDLNNFGPRIGLAFRLNEQTVVRAGGAIFYAPMSGGGFNNTTYAMSQLAETGFIASLDNGVSPTPGTDLSNPFGSGIVRPASDYQGALYGYGQASLPVRLRATRQPLISQWNLNVQRELPGRLLLEAAYAGSAGAGLLSGATDLNQLTPEALAVASRVVNGQPLGNLTLPNPFLNLAPGEQPPAASILGRASVTVAQLLRPYPQFGNIVSYGQNEAHSSYHSMQVTVTRRFDDDLTFSAAYAFSKLIDDLTGITANNLTIQAPYYQNYYNRRADKSVSNFDVTHRFIGDLTWRLPFGRTKRFAANGAAAKILGGFSLNAIVQAQSGFPLSITAANPALQGLAFIALRPNIVGEVKAPDSSGAARIGQYFNTLAFAQPAPYTLGDAPRTIANLRGPGYLSANMALHREFAPAERLKLQLRLEMFNAFNRANFQAPGTALGAANFGVITGTEDPRQVQLAVRVHF